MRYENEDSFKVQFIANFLSSWCVKNYSEESSLDKQGDLSKPPVEIANKLANDAWEHYTKVCEMKRDYLKSEYLPKLRPKIDPGIMCGN